MGGKQRGDERRGGDNRRGEGKERRGEERRGEERRREERRREGMTGERRDEDILGVSTSFPSFHITYLLYCHSSTGGHSDQPVQQP